MPILIVIVVLLIAAIIVMYNSLVTDRNNVRNAWSQIDVQLQRRFDLIPNLIETVKGYMEHENDLLTKIAELRTSWTNSSTVSEKANLDNQLSQTLKSILAVSENYPDLKASQNFLELQNELQNTEDKISHSRTFYNDAVTKYNTRIEMFPSSLIASAFNFHKEDLFKIENEEIKQNVKVSF